MKIIINKLYYKKIGQKRKNKIVKFYKKLLKLNLLKDQPQC